jgi:hypothetical protein
MMFFMCVLITSIYVILPAAFVAFYMAPSVRETFQVRDPVPRWTDACPLPVLGLSLMMAYGAVFGLLGSLANASVMPLFGVLITGLPGFLIMLAFCLLWGWLAWHFFKLDTRVWWPTIIVVLVLAASNAITFWNVGMIEFLEKMGTPERDLNIFRGQKMFAREWIVGMSLVTSAAFLAYVIWIRKYLKKPNV